MLASLLIVFREVLEAGLVVGIVLAATAGVPGRGVWVAGGIAAGTVGALIVAAFAGAISAALAGFGQEIFAAAILILAVCMLGWHNIWMSKHGRELAAHMKEIGRAVKGGQKSLLALAVVVGVAVLREGSETVLFLYGVALSGQNNTVSMIIGGLAGFGCAMLVAYLLYRGLLAIPTRYFFTVTNGLITLLAAGMAGQAAAILAGADIIPSWGERIWNLSNFLPDDSWLGNALHTLIGYSAKPCGVQVAAYLATLIALATMAKLAGSSPSTTNLRTEERSHAS